MKVITIPIIKEWGEPPEYKTIFNVDDELAKYIKTLEETSNHIFANVNDDELLRSNAMNYKEAQEYKDRIDKAIKLLNKYRNRKDNYCLWCMEYIDNAEVIKVLGGEKEKEQVKEVIEQISYQEFYRYYQEKDTLIEQQEKEIKRLKERENILQKNFSDWKKGIEKERKYYLCERTDCCGRIKDSKKYSSLYQKNKRLNNIINELERYINEEYIYDELGMKIFDASKLQDKLQELKGSENSE